MKIKLAFAIILLFAAQSLARVEDNRAMDQFIRGTMASQLDNHYQAVFHFQEALRNDSNSVFVHVALAQEYILLGDPARALEVLDKALRYDSKYMPALELKGLVLRSLGRYSEARKALEKLVTIDPKNVDYKVELLTIFLTSGDFEKVDEIYFSLPDSNAANELLTRQILTVLLISDRYDKAIPYMERLVAYDSTDASLVFSLGTLYLQSSDTTRGIEKIMEAVSVDSTEPQFWYARCVLEFDRGNLESVLNLADTATLAAGPYAPLEHLRGNTLRELGRRPEAVEALKQSVALDSTLFMAQGSLALIYDEMDSVDQAVNSYEEAIKFSDSAAVYLNNLAYTYAVRGIELEKARELVLAALKAEPDNSSYLDTIGWIEFQAGQIDEAEEWLKQALKIDPRSAPILEHMGDILAASDRADSAKKFYKKALQEDPQNPALRDKVDK